MATAKNAEIKGPYTINGIVVDETVKARIEEATNTPIKTIVQGLVSEREDQWNKHFFHRLAMELQRKLPHAGDAKIQQAKQFIAGLPEPPDPEEDLAP